MLPAGENHDRAARGIHDYVVKDPRDATSQRSAFMIFCRVGIHISPPAAAGGVVGGPVRGGNPAQV